MGKLTDDMSRLVDEIGTMDESRDNFIKGIKNAVKQKTDESRQFMKRTQDVVKQKADETRQFLANFGSEMDSAHEAFFGRKTFRKR